MPLNEQVYNATFEKHEVMIFSRVFSFEPRDFTAVPEQYIPALEMEHYEKGLIVIRHGEDLKEKERAALIAYLGLLNRRIAHYQSWMDMEKSRGSTVEEPRASIQAKKWREQIRQKLNVEAPVEVEKSFLDNDDLKLEAQKMFAGLAEAQVVKKKPGKPKTNNFLEEDLSKEVGE